MKNWLYEPLLHFTVAGALLFAAYSYINHEDNNEPQVVVISSAEVNWMKEVWSRQWHRQPSADELRDLVNGYIKEELLAREAKAIGLDENDTIIRRRLAQKMEFIMQDTANLADPLDEVLRTYYTKHIADYQLPARISFTQIFFKTELAASQTKDQIAGANILNVGDPSLLEREVTKAEEAEVASIFGADFAKQAFALAPYDWQGPIASSYGYHLVLVSDLDPAVTLPFKDTRERVIADWGRVEQEKASAKYFAGLMKKYEVKIDDSIKSMIQSMPAVYK